LFFWSSAAYSADFGCVTNERGAYCKYVGKIKRLYINSDNIMYVYFEKALDMKKAEAIGFNNVKNEMAGLKLNENNKLFFDLRYRTFLTAKANDMQVSFQMRSVEGGYLKIDRIWLDK
jgi:hypothetical protein